MAELLYRLGKWSAGHAKTVVAIWLALLVALGATVGVVGINFTDALSVGDTATTRVTDRLGELADDAGEDSGTDSVQMVAQTTDGGTFTAEQQDAIAAVIAKAKQVDEVADVNDPFASEAEREDGQQQLVDGQTQLDAARTEALAGQAQLDAGRAQLDAGQAQLDAGKAQLTASAAQMPADMLAAQQAQLDAQQAQLDAQRTQLDASQQELTDGLAEIDVNQATIDDGTALMDLAAGIRTVSEDGTTAVITVSFTTSSGTPPAGAQADVRDVFADNPVDGVTFMLSGGTTVEMSELIGIGEIIGLIIAAIALIMMLGTLIAAGLPLITALIGVGVGMTITVTLAAFTDVATVTPMLGLMLGLAVGIDYSLFIVNRHRQQLRAGHSVIESAGLATGTSGNAVVFAGLTVIIALAALNVTGLPFIGLMGTVGAMCVAIAVLVAITLTPALLGLAGTRVLRKNERTAKPKPLPQATAQPVWRSLVTVVVGIAALVVVALPALDMRTNLPDNSSQPKDSASYQAYTAMADTFGEGMNSPLIVMADLPSGLSEAELTATELTIARDIASHDTVTAVAPVMSNDDNTVVVFQVLPSEGPAAESTTTLVHELRASSPIAGEYEIGVAGMAAANIDMSEKISDSLLTYLIVVIGLSLLILIVVFRSILVPVVATAGFVLSYFATLGGVVAIYQWGWLADLFGVSTPGPILSFLPTILVGILFGLAMDYMLFLGSGMREAYVHGAEPRVAIAQGVRAGRAVVIAAAIIMISVFGGFVFSHVTMIRPIGFALAFGVLVDAFIVRLLIVPALLSLFGKAAWWIPAWLDKLLPNVDVEGAGLERAHP